VCVALTALLACRSYQEPADTATRQRLISLSPSVTEILYGVGAFSSLVAVSEYCDYPEEARQLPRVGGFTSASLESILALSPDLIILLEAQSPFFKDKLDEMGLRTLVVKNKTVADTVEAIRLIGRGTGHHAEGDRLADEVRRRIDQRIEETKNLPRLRVLCSVDHVPGTLKDVYTASEGSFLDELIMASGGQNIAPPGDRGYSKIQQEAIVDSNPQVIIDIVHKPSVERLGDPRSVWQALPEIEAVRTGRISIVSDPFVTHPSQRILETLDVFSRIIHPEVFGRYV
jgi:iron complex transport system substrate-binding protein